MRLRFLVALLVLATVSGVLLSVPFDYDAKAEGAYQETTGKEERR